MKVTGYSRVSKDLIIKELDKELKERKIFFVTRHDTVPAANLDKLRAKLRAGKSRYFAVKNSLGAKALEKANLKDMASRLEGKCGIAFASGDPVTSSKVLMDFAKENESFKVQAGYLNGQIMDASQIKVLASLPSREVLLSRLFGQMNAPVTGLVTVLSGTLRKFVTVIDAIQKKKS